MCETGIYDPLTFSELFPFGCLNSLHGSSFTVSSALIGTQAVNDHDDSDDQDDQGKRVVQQFLRAAAHERLGTAQVLFKDGSQNKANGNRHDGQLHGTDHNCDQAEVQQAPHIKHAVAAAKCAHTAHAQDDGHQQVLRSRQNLDKTLDAEQHEEQHEQRGQA